MTENLEWVNFIKRSKKLVKTYQDRFLYNVVARIHRIKCTLWGIYRSLKINNFFHVPTDWGNVTRRMPTPPNRFFFRRVLRKIVSATLEWSPPCLALATIWLQRLVHHVTLRRRLHIVRADSRILKKGGQSLPRMEKRRDDHWWLGLLKYKI